MKGDKRSTCHLALLLAALPTLLWAQETGEQEQEAANPEAKLK